MATYLEVAAVRRVNHGAAYDAVLAMDGGGEEEEQKDVSCHGWRTSRTDGSVIRTISCTTRVYDDELTDEEIKLKAANGRLFMHRAA